MPNADLCVMDKERKKTHYKGIVLQLVCMLQLLLVIDGLSDVVACLELCCSKYHGEGTSSLECVECMLL